MAEVREWLENGGSIDRAVTHCEQALAIDNRLAPVHVMLATLARGRGRYEEAVVFGRRALELDPVSGDAYRELGRAQEALTRFAEAEVTYKQAVDAHPDDWLATTRSAASTSLGRERPRRKPPTARARTDAGRPPRLQQSGATIQTAARRRRGGDVREVDSDQGTFSAASNLGTYYFIQGRYTDAARSFERAVTLQPADRRVSAEPGRLAVPRRPASGKVRAGLRKGGRAGEADRKINPRQPGLLAELADAYAMLGSRTEALAAVAAVERLGGGNAEHAFMIAAADERLGDRAAALGWLEQALAKKYRSRPSNNRRRWRNSQGRTL